MSTQDKNKIAVEKFFSSFGKAEHSSYYDTYFHKDHKLYFPMFPLPVDSEDHRKIDEGFISGFPDTKIVIDDIFSADNKVVLRGKFTGTHKGEFNNIPPTGKNISLSFISIIEFRDGKNICEWVEMDTIKMMQQLGLVPDQS